MIEADGLSKDYGSKRALNRASFKIPANEVVGLLGPNGAGKTTLMKILTGYLHPSEGTARIGGIDVVEQALPVRSMIGYLPENAPVYPDMLVQEYLQMIASLRDVPEGQRTQLIGDAVRRVGLRDFLVRPISELSKGFRQRVGLAQAILHRPKVLILDEPTSGLDPRQIVEIRRLIADLAKTATVLLSTHILPEVEISCERVLIISDGEVRADAQMADLRASNGAIVSVDAPLSKVNDALKTIAGVKSVVDYRVPGAEGGQGAGFSLYRVTGEGSSDLCPQIFDIIKGQGWRMAELRPDQQTLENVFRSVVDRGSARPAVESGVAA